MTHWVQISKDFLLHIIFLKIVRFEVFIHNAESVARIVYA